MNSETAVREFQANIIKLASNKLGSGLSEPETRFITSRGGFVALEGILDTVRGATTPPAKQREWILHDLDSGRLGSLGAALVPVFSVSGEQVVYYSPKLNGELWMWDIETNRHRKIGATGYISQLRTTPAGVMFLLHEGTDAITAATVDETTWNVRTIAGPTTP